MMQEKRIKYPGAGVRGGCDLPNVSAGNRTQVLCKSSILGQTTLVGYMCLSHFCKGLWRSLYHLIRHFLLLVRSSLCFYPGVTCKASLFIQSKVQSIGLGQRGQTEVEQDFIYIDIKYFNYSLCFQPWKGMRLLREMYNKSTFYQLSVLDSL